MKPVLYFSIIFFSILSCSEPSQKTYDQWSSYLGGPERNHFTTLSQIHKGNLDSLEIVWIYEAPDTGQMQMNPIIANGLVYGVTAALKAFALDAATGEQVWIYGDSEKVWRGISRGVAYWEEGDDKRILYTIGKDLIALNALTGEPIQSFGENGRVDLHLGLPEVAKDKFITSTTPGTIYKDIIVMPVRLSEAEDAAPGDIRAFNIKDGTLAWSFHVIPYPGEAGYETWEQKEAYKNESLIGAGNCWAGMAVDEESGIFYVPTGSFAPDFYGGHRKGSNLYSDCLLALDALTGKLIWHFQFTHHDIWDRDLPAPPNLITVRRGRKNIKAVAQVTKQGYVYVFDRKTGEPLFDIEEVPVPSSPLAEEEAWPTQPIPVKPKPYSRRSDELTSADISPYAQNKEELLTQFNAAHKAFYFPPDTTEVLLLPGYDGGAEWGGAGADPEDGILYVNANEMAWMLDLVSTEGNTEKPKSRGEQVYIEKCAVCHQADLSGVAASGFPALKGIKTRMEGTEILNIIMNGKGMMPGNAGLGEDDQKAVVDFLLEQEGEDKQEVVAQDEGAKLPYKHGGYKKWLDANGLPAISPPWGTLSAIDLNSGEFLWQIPFGQVDSLISLGFPETGVESYGGPIITENGLLIIGASKDGFLRIFDKRTGELLWKERLPAASFATPATYMAEGRQYIVMACGGEKLGTKPGNKIIAYALKQ